MSRPATVEKQLREAFEALKEEGNKAPTLKEVSDKAGKKKVYWGKYPTLHREVQQYAATHKKSVEKKAAKKKAPSNTLKKKNAELQEMLRRTTDLLIAYQVENDQLRAELGYEQNNVVKLR